MTDSRTLDSRIEVLSPDDVSLADIHPSGCTVKYQGAASERWAADLVMADMYPVDADDLLHPLSRNRVRVWWRELVDGAWAESLVMTGYPEDPGGRKSPGLTWTLQVVDTITEAKRGGYAGQTLEVGGLTVGAALDALFALVAPNLPRWFPSSSVTLPPTYTLGTSDDVEGDWSKIAAVAGWTVYSDRAGTITAGPTPNPSASKAQWQEGDGCEIVELAFAAKTSTIKNVWLAKSASSEIVPPIVGRAQDDDPGSPTWVGVYGPYPGTITLDTIGEQVGADNAAAQALAENRRPMATVTVTAPPRPDFDYFDAVDFGSPDVGVVGPYHVESWDLSMPSAGQDPSLMSVTMVSRSVAV